MGGASDSLAVLTLTTFPGHDVYCTSVVQGGRQRAFLYVVRFRSLGGRRVVLSLGLAALPPFPKAELGARSETNPCF